VTTTTGWRRPWLTVAIVAACSATAIAQDAPVVRASFTPAGPVIVGQPVTLTVQVLVPNYFLAAPDWPVTLDIDGAIVTLSDEVLPHLNETIHGKSYVGVQQQYTISPQQEGEVTLPPVELRFQYASVPGQPPADGVVTLPPSHFTARWPPGARTDAGVLPVARLTVAQTLDRQPVGLKAGDAITRTITVTAAHTQPMMIPPATFDAPDGVRVYRKDPSLTAEQGVRSELVAGRRVDRATYLFEKPGHYTLPAIVFPWFDVAAGTQREATAPAIEVDIAPGTAAAPAIAPEAPPPPPAPPPPSPWRIWKRRLPWIAGGLALVLACAWLWRRLWPPFRQWATARRLERRESEGAYYARVGAACGSNDPARTYAALARWAGRAGFPSVHALCGALGSDRLTAEVRTLERGLYGSGPGLTGWSGTALRHAVDEARHRWLSQGERAGRKRMLPGLNPPWSAVVLVLALVLGGSREVGASQAAPQAPAETPPRVGAYTIRPDVGESGKMPAPGETDAAAPRKQGLEWVFAPMPMINPTLDNGLAGVVGVLYHVGHSKVRSPPSVTFVSGFKTSNGSWAVAVAEQLHLFDDRLRVNAAAAHLDLNLDFYGIGSEAGAAGRSIELNHLGYGVVTEALIKVRGPWYAGGRYRISDTTVTPNLSDSPVPLPEVDFTLRTALLGPHVEYDSRNNPFYPRHGQLFDGMALFAGSAVGGVRTYQSYAFAYSSYRSLGPTQVLAAKANTCFTSGNVPFYDLCMLGSRGDLRGYDAGQYRDRVMLTGQAEYRLEVWRRWGLAVFGGLGEVAPTVSDMNGANVLPSGGAGLRLTLAKRNHVNLRADYAWGRDSSALYISVGEAF
jgi:hypothetical protein